MMPRLPTLRSLVCAIPFLTVLSVISLGTAIAADMRTWSDASGKFKIQGKFVSNDKGKITLEKPDGTEMEIELKKLSTADQKYVADQEKNADSPFKAKSDDPFKSKPTTKGKPAADKDPEPRKSSSSTRLIVPDYSDVRVVTVIQPNEPWKFEIPEAPAATTAKPKAKMIATPKKTDFFEGAKSLAGSPGGKFAAIGYQLQKPGVNQPATTRVVVCNLESAKVSAEGSLPGKQVLLAVSEDGKQVLLRRDEFGHGSQDRLEIWDMAAKSASKGIQWVPHDDFSGGDRDVVWGAFIGNERLCTVSGKGKLVVWEVDEMKPLYQMEIQGGSKPAISPDQKWLAFAGDKSLGILNLAEGELVALQTMSHAAWPNLLFSPGQSKLGMAAHDRLLVWDFATGELYREMPYNGLHVMGNITWPSEEHVLLGNRYLIDLENQVKLWDYDGGDFAQQIGGMTWFVVSDGQKPGALMGAQLPPPAVKDALAKAMSQPDFFVLKPGTTVKIDVSGVDAAGKDFVEKALAARLKEAGFDSGPSGTIDLIAQTEIGQPRQITYRTIGPGRGSETYTVRDYYCRVKFLYKGQEVWQTMIGSGPGGFVRLGQNETMEQYLRKSEKFNFDWFGKVDLPKLLQKPTQLQATAPGAPPSHVPTVGSTKLTTAGAR
jgi:hypothetical protein